MDPNLKAAALGASSITPPASPLGASSAPELAQLYASGFQLPQATGATTAAGNIASTTVKAAQDAATQQQDLTNLKSYTIVKKGDGGYDFYDPTGQQVDIATVSQRTGTSPKDLVANSENPIDIQYRNDQTNLQDYVNAVLSGDKKKIAAYQAAQPALKQYTGRGGVDQLIQKFKQEYQRYYVTRAQNPNAWGAVPGGPVVPTADSSAFAQLDTSGGVGS